jgi:hypothetical protein
MLSDDYRKTVVPWKTGCGKTIPLSFRARWRAKSMPGACPEGAQRVEWEPAFLAVFNCRSLALLGMTIRWGFPHTEVMPFHKNSAYSEAGLFWPASLLVVMGSGYQGFVARPSKRHI